MRPIPIPDQYLEEMGGVRHTVGAPAGYEKSVQPLEVIAGKARIGGEEGADANVFATLLEFDEEDLDQLAKNGKRMWLIFWGAVIPFNVGVCDTIPEKYDESGIVVEDHEMPPDPFVEKP